jgi:hypothetical protein
MKTKTPHLLFASAVSAIALFAFTAVHAEDQAAPKQTDAGKKDTEECQDKTSCNGGGCNGAAKQDKDTAAEKKTEASAAKPASASSDQ